MSNTAVGNVYLTIIEEVINASRVDFEEGGVDESVLDELRRGWQHKLTQLDVAGFPWDPKPEPVPAAAAPVPAPIAPSVSTAAPPLPQYSQAQLTPQLPPSGIALPNAPGLVKPEPAIKQEIGLLKQDAGLGNIPAGRANEARLRATQNLQAQFGSRAAGSINAIQANIGGQPPRPQSNTPINPPHFRPGVPNPGQPGLQTAQTDGNADVDDDDLDVEGMLMQRDAAGNLMEMGRVEIDRLLHAQIASRAKAMEGGGLMLPLKEATKHRTARSARPGARAAGIIGYDGPGGDDDDIAEDDEDAINSDLDDSDEGAEEEDADDDTLQHVMLCMYDKVQRVKNKWKCVLKDGVLTVNGKEYVFHKATGEYEW